MKWLKPTSEKPRGTGLQVVGCAPWRAALKNGAIISNVAMPGEPGR